MSKAWLKNGKILMKDGKVILCDHCPCDDSSSSSSESSSLESSSDEIRGCENSPAITTTPPGSGTVGVEYQYDAEADDDDLPDDDFTWVLTDAPPDATVTDSNDNPSKGLVRWTPPASGFYEFGLKAIDDCGNESAEQIWAVFV